MKAAWVEAGDLGLKQRPLPRSPSGWALLRVACAGVCGTDLALHKGLYGFRGTPGHEQFAAVADCSGTAAGIHAALDAVRPRGTLVLKGTSVAQHSIDLDRVVVDEIRLLGSRCGPMELAVDWLHARRIDPRPLISSRRGLNQICSAFRDAAACGQMKVLVSP